MAAACRCIRTDPVDKGLQAATELRRISRGTNMKADTPLVRVIGHCAILCAGLKHHDSGTTTQAAASLH